VRKGEQGTLVGREVCVLLNIHPSTLSRMVRDRKIPHMKFGGAIRFDSAQLDAWMRKLTINQCGQVPPPPTT